MLLNEQAAAIAAADELCRQEPLQAAIRTELLQLHRLCLLERENGFDPRDIRNTHVFQLGIHRPTAAAGSVPLTRFSSLIRALAVQGDMDVHTVLDAAASTLAGAPLDADAPPNVTAFIGSMVHESAWPQGWEPFGVGFISVGMSMRSDHLEALGDWDQMTAEKLAADPNAVPLWYMHVVTADMRVWSLLHQQGYDLVYGSTSADEPAPGVDCLGTLTSLWETMVSARLTPPI
jgi:hypothetical protein